MTEQRLCHAAGISLGQRGQRDPSRVTGPRVRHAVGISLGSAAERRDSCGWQNAYRLKLPNIMSLRPCAYIGVMIVEDMIAEDMIVEGVEERGAFFVIQQRVR